MLVEDKITLEGKGTIFPGGHVEKHKPVMDSVILEMQEETGSSIEKLELCDIKKWINEDGRGIWVSCSGQTD